MLALPLVISEGPLAGIIIAMNITSVSTIDYLDSNNWYTVRVFVSLINLDLYRFSNVMEWHQLLEQLYSLLTQCTCGPL